MNRYALLISCEDYKEYSNIEYCHSDAFLVEDVLINYCDYKRDNVTNLMLYPNCDESNPKKILDKLNESIKTSEEGDTILFYFAGHGILHNNEGYLLLPNTCKCDISNTALSIKDLNKCLSKNNRGNFRIFDACHSGVDSRSGKENGFSSVLLDDAWITLASCAKDEESYTDKEKEQGIFTYCLVESIKEFNKDELIFVEELKLKVCNKMIEWCNENNKKQTPTMHAAVSGNMAIATKINNCEGLDNKGIIECLGGEFDLTKRKEEITSVTIIENNAVNTLYNKKNLWESPEGIILPKRADINELLSYNVQLKSKELKQINIAYNTESYEMLAKFVWDISLSILQRKVLGLGVDFVSDMIGIDNIEYIYNLPVFETINLAFELGFINKLGKLRLKNNNELIQEYLLRETDEEMTEDQAKEIVRCCIQYVLGQDNSNLNLEYNNFRDNLKLQLIENNKEQLDMILNSPYFYKKTTVRTLMNLIKETEGTENYNVSRNMIKIIPYVWNELRSEEKYYIGLNYAKYSNNSNEKFKDVLKAVLMKVKGFDYVPENLKSLTFIESSKKLVEAHYGYDNFYKEIIAIKELESLGTVIPNPALEQVINSVLLVKLGNSYGLSYDAQSYADKILDRIGLEQWSYYIKYQFMNAEDILLKISQKDNRCKRWFEIVEKYKLYNIDVLNQDIKILLDKSREKDKYAAGAVALKLYNTSLEQSI